MRDYQESVTIGQTDTRTHTQTDAGQSDPYVPLCFAGDTKISETMLIKCCCRCNDWKKAFSWAYLDVKHITE